MSLVEDPFADQSGPAAPNDDWMLVQVWAPLEVGRRVLDRLRAEDGFVEVDWTVLGRPEDHARVDYAPCEPLTSSEVRPESWGEPSS